MAMESYRYSAEVLVRDYLLADPFVPYTSVLVGIFMCKLVYDLTQLMSSSYFKGFTSLTKIQQIEWSNRGISTVHAIFITIMSLYFVFFSDLYSDAGKGPITFRCSNLSNFTLGVSVGYFITDMAMILWLYPSLGGMEYVLHHFLSLIAVVYAMMFSEGQIYIYMVLISETTTPGINLRWFLDTAGMKRSKAYIVNGVMMFLTWMVSDCGAIKSAAEISAMTMRLLAVLVLSWRFDAVEEVVVVVTELLMMTVMAMLIATQLCFSVVTELMMITVMAMLVARIFLFIYLFYHIFSHYDEVEQMHNVGYLLVFGVSSILSVMNMMWFAKILKGLQKTLAKRQ